MGTEACAAALHELRTHLVDSNASVRIAALRALARMECRGDAPADAVKKCLADDDADVKREALTTFAALADVDDKRVCVRATWPKWRAHREEYEVGPCRCKAEKDEIRRTRRGVLDAVADALCSEQAELCRLSAVEAFNWLAESGKFERDELEPLVEVMLDDDQSDAVRLEAISALEGFGASCFPSSSSVKAKVQALTLIEGNEILCGAARGLLYKFFDSW